MSFINLVATLYSPSYPAISIVHYRGMVDPEEVQEEEVQVAARSDLENGNILTLPPDEEIRTIAVEEAVSNQVVSEEAGDRKEGESVYPEYW